MFEQNHASGGKIVPLTHVSVVLLNATPGVLLNQRFHQAPRLLPVADVRGDSGQRESKDTGLKSYIGNVMCAADFAVSVVHTGELNLLYIVPNNNTPHISYEFHQFLQIHSQQKQINPMIDCTFLHVYPSSKESEPENKRTCPTH